MNDILSSNYIISQQKMIKYSRKKNWMKKSSRIHINIALENPKFHTFKTDDFVSETRNNQTQPHFIPQGNKNPITGLLASHMIRRIVHIKAYLDACMIPGENRSAEWTEIKWNEPSFRREAWTDVWQWKIWCSVTTWAASAKQEHASHHSNTFY